MGVLDDAGYVNKIEAGAMKICKGSMVVIKGLMRSGLFHLVGETLIGTSAIVTAPEDKNAALWHKRLWHISDRGLQIMSDQKLFGQDKISKVDFCEHCVLGK